MKKFNFRLEKVLNYKNQVLDGLKNEHAAILRQVHLQEKVIEDLQRTYANTCKKYNEEKLNSTLKLENIMQYENYLNRLDERIKAEQAVLAELKIKEDKKRQEVVRAKQDSESIEKLKEKQKAEYNKELRAEQSQIVEEFISNRISGS